MQNNSIGVQSEALPLNDTANKIKVQTVKVKPCVIESVLNRILVVIFDHIYFISDLK